MRYSSFATTLIALMSFIVSCSGHSSQPVAPGINGLTAPQSISDSGDFGSGIHLWSLWEVSIDADNGMVEAIPLRGAEFTCNVVRFMDGPPSNLGFNLVSMDIGPDYRDFVIDVAMLHPFPGLTRYTGFDVIGVFMGEGSETIPYSPELNVAGDVDQQLLNPDGYTRWFNAPEFGYAGGMMPLAGFYPGRKGTPDYYPSAILNPYRYFTDGLAEEDEEFGFLMDNAADRGKFTPGSLNERRYELRFPTGTPIRFQYAIIAHWEPNLSFPDPPPDIDDFPITANADEAVVLSVIDDSTLYYVDDEDFGGAVQLDISPWDWSMCESTAMREYTLEVYSDAWVGGCPVDMTPIAQGECYETFDFDYPAEILTSNEPLAVWIEVIYSDLDYKLGFGPDNDAEGALTSYFRVDVPVAEEQQAWIEVLIPNGGEEWAVGSTEEILWDSEGIPGDVLIRYSKDDFQFDINTIATDVPATAESYLWEDIPNDPSDTVKVRVISQVDQHMWDDSDDYFSIVLPAWIEVTSPNGSEKWQAGCDEEITWDSDYVPGTVFIEYSKDNFAADINPISIDETNDGSFMWEGIPFDISDTVRVRVSATDDPGINDTSDDDFSIVESTGYAHTWGDGQDDRGDEVAVDAAGNAYVAGYFYGTVDFDPGPDVDEHFAGDHWGAYLVKYGPCSDFQWARTWSGTADTHGHGVAVSDTGEVFVTGSFEGTTDFDPGPGTSQRTTNGSWDAYLSQFNSEGDFQWVRTWGSSSGDFGRELVTDDAGNVYVTGPFRETADFDPGGAVVQYTANGLMDIFLSKFDPAGTFQWARTWGGLEDDMGIGLAFYSPDTVYVSGYFGGADVDFDPGGGTDLHDSNGYSDVFLSRLDTSGTFQWARTWGGSNINGDSSWGVATDSLGCAYAIGVYSGSVDFDPGVGTVEHTSNGGRDVFLSKFDGAGEFQWVQTWGGSGHEEGLGVAVDSLDRIACTGRFLDEVDFDPGPEVYTCISNGEADVYINRLEATGDFIWARTWGGEGHDEGYGIAVDGYGSAFVVGEFSNLVNFAPSDPSCSETPVEHVSNGMMDCFFVRYLSDGCW
jgi:hypothetical protein